MRKRATDSTAPAPTAAEGMIRRASGTRRIDARVLEMLEPFGAAAQRGWTAPGAPATATAARLQLRIAPGRATLLAGPTEGELLPGLIAAVTCAGARIATAAQHRDRETGSSFQRIALTLEAGSSAAAALERQLGSLAHRTAMSFSVSRADRPRRVALLVSKYEHCLHDLLLRQRAGELDCEISLVLSNHPDLSPVARQFGVDYQLIGKRADDKAGAESRAHELLESREVELVVLARYMQILSADFVARWSGRLINVHHSLLPAFVGAKPYHQAWQRGVKLIGATAHYVTADLDQGPIIEQEVVRCSHEHGVEDLIRKGRDLERLVLARAVRWHLEDRIFISGGRTLVFS